MNLSNALTLIRILLVPAFLIAVIYERPAAALALFLTAGVTDLLDGLAARRLGQETRLGAFLDPVADKLLVAVSFISLAAFGLLPAWLAVLVVSKDLFVSLGVAVLHFTGERVTADPTRGGKLTTFLQIGTVAMVLLTAATGQAAGVLPFLFALTGGVTVLSGLHYIWRGLRALPPADGGG